jgi:hypothetical protein
MIHLAAAGGDGGGGEPVRAARQEELEALLVEGLVGGPVGKVPGDRGDLAGFVGTVLDVGDAGVGLDEHFPELRLLPPLAGRLEEGGHGRVVQQALEARRLHGGRLSPD